MKSKWGKIPVLYRNALKVERHRNSAFQNLSFTKADEPLAIIIQSSSAAGKSWLMDFHRLLGERQTLEGMWARDERQALRKLHRDARRLLRPLEVVNPFARELTFLDDQTTTPRDHMKYLALIQFLACRRDQSLRLSAKRRFLTEDRDN